MAGKGNTSLCVSHIFWWNKGTKNTMLIKLPHILMTDISLLNTISGVSPLLNDRNGDT